MTDLTALIARVERLEGPDREVDCLVDALVRLRGPFVIVGPPTYDPPRFFCNPNPEIDWIGYDLLNVSPHVTASLDAVVALAERVLPGWRWGVMTAVGPESRRGPFMATLDCPESSGFGMNARDAHATPALALLLALLRAVQAEQNEETTGES